MNEAQARARTVALFQEATPSDPEAPIEQWREGFEAMAEKLGLPDDLRIEEIDCNGVPALKVMAPEARDDRLAIHYHSGGYVMGSANAYREFAGRLSRSLKAPVVVPDYRLAPENPYPAAVEDGLAVYRWAIGRIDPASLMICGDSAGGGLCMATLLNIREMGLPNPCGAVAICPLLDLAGEGDSADIESDPIIGRELIVGMGKVYIGEIDPKLNPLCSPLWAEHHDLPPIFLMASASEALRDDSIRMAESIREAGGKVRISTPDDLIHIWTFFPFLEAAKQSMAEIAEFAEDCFPG